MGLANTRQYAEAIALEVECINHESKNADPRLAKQKDELVFQPVTLCETTLSTGRSTSLLAGHVIANPSAFNLSGRSSEYQKSEFFLQRTLENMSTQSEGLIYSVQKQAEVPLDDSYKLDLQNTDNAEEKLTQERSSTKITQLITSIQGDIGRSSIQSIKGSLIDLTVE